MNMATDMEYRQLGGCGFKVPPLCLGTGTFGGANEFFKAWGAVGVDEATRLVDICLEAGMNFFDSADVYSEGTAEEVLGGAIKGRRDKVLISTKATFRAGTGPTMSAPHSFISCRPSKEACAAWKPTISTCSNCTVSTP
jgi:aryl-alcohol dehydrogenase-like predicted oxidoreductase